MESAIKIKHTMDALFGVGTSKYLPRDTVITYSKRTGRIQHVYKNTKLLCTLRIDGGLAITPFFAQLLLKSKKFIENCVKIDEDSKRFVEKGSSVFCKHVIWCGNNVMIGSDVPVLYKDKVVAVGKAVLSAKMIKSLNRGVAIKVRDSLKSVDY